MSAQADLQGSTLRAYTVLNALGDNWGGALILNVALDGTGAAVSLAANAAGAVSLTLDSDAGRLRLGLRSGACDFVVNTLDEALRAIKNEVRQHRPLSVGLEGDPSLLLAEMLERGVAPQIFTAPELFPAEAARFECFGARLVSFGTVAAQRVLETFLADPSRLDWSLETFLFASPAQLRAFDAAAQAQLPLGDTLRRRWLASASRLFPRERSRTLWLARAEKDCLTRAVTVLG